jgi:two-component system, NtrC family, response regulator AtoC
MNQPLVHDRGAQKHCGELVGASPVMERVFQMIMRVSRSRDSVLIMGETGTGKELVARAIHYLGHTRDKPFLPVDCCTVVPGLIETELFGYLRGAFTGALHSKTGLFEAAHKGTVFLDEIAEMPVSAQSKLLRAIQERQIRPVGGTGWRAFDARLIAATNRDLERAVQEGTFREDLYFRLSVLSIRLPPLRERKADIPILAAHLLSKVCHDQWNVPVLSDAALQCLLSYRWPGNVRELENCMRWAVTWCSGAVIHPDDLPPQVRQPVIKHLTSERHDCGMPSLQEVEREAILRALAVANGDKVVAARLLGIGKTTIYRKLKQYGIG